MSALLSVPTPAFDVACVGISLQGLNAMTVDAVRYLMCGKVVYCYPASQQQLAWLHELNENVVDLNVGLYRDGRYFNQAYNEIIDEVVRAAAETGSVVYAQQGSPAFLAYTAHEVRRRAQASGLITLMSPGVSSLECILVALGETRNITNFQVLDCTSLYDGKVKVNPALPCFLNNLGALASARISKKANRLEVGQLELFQSCLAQVYRADHPVFGFMIYPSGKLVQMSWAIGSLAKDLENAPQATTLFLPAL